MRIIRTEIYFDADQIKDRAGNLQKNDAGLAFAFFRGDDFPINHLGIYSDHAARILTNSVDITDRLSEESLKALIDAMVRGITFDKLNFRHLEFVPDGEGVKNYYLAETALATNIVIEYSPPEWITLREVLKKASSIPAGIFLGYYGLQEPLLFLTLPAGVIVMGAAFGINKAVENGLPKYVQNKLKQMYQGR
jgi:hypothetical protein